MSFLRLRLKLRSLVHESVQSRQATRKHLGLLREMRIRDRLAHSGYNPKQIERIAKRALRRKLFADPVAQITKGLEMREGMLKAAYEAHLSWAGHRDPANAPRPEWIVAKGLDLNMLANHRRKYIRPAIRELQLAYAYLRGRPYAVAESFMAMKPRGNVNTPIRGRYVPPNWKSVVAVASHYGPDKQDGLEAWVAEAKKYRASRGIDDGSKKRDAGHAPNAN